MWDGVGRGRPGPTPSPYLPSNRGSNHRIHFYLTLWCFTNDLLLHLRAYFWQVNQLCLVVVVLLWWRVELLDGGWWAGALRLSVPICLSVCLTDCDDASSRPSVPPSIQSSDDACVVREGGWIHENGGTTCRLQPNYLVGWERCSRTTNPTIDR